MDRYTRGENDPPQAIEKPSVLEPKKRSLTFSRFRVEMVKYLEAYQRGDDQRPGLPHSEGNCLGDSG